jgi:predicted nucleic acid-binding protein
MTDFLIDTNCLLSYFTDRSPEQHVAISSYVLRASQLELSLTVVPHVLSELVYVLERVYQQPAPRVADLIAKTLKTPGIEYLDLHPMHEILKVWPTDMVQYGDAVIAATARVTGLAVLTFDRGFARGLLGLNIGHQVP